MVDVILDTQDIRVLGGPSIVNLELDFGKPGPRGSYIYAGVGKPGPETLPVSYQINDLYLNLDEEDDEYTYLYQYITTIVDEVEQNDWVRLFRLLPALALGTAAQRDVPAIGDALDNQVVLGDDTRLTNMREPIENSVSTTKIVNQAVTNDKLADGSVTDIKIADATITGGKLANGTITNTQIANTTITGGKLQSKTITATQIADATITATQIANSTITNTKLSNSSVTINGKTVALGESIVLGGGVTASDTPPVDPQPGAGWFDTNDGSLYIYYTDGSSSQWVEVY